MKTPFRQGFLSRLCVKLCVKTIWSDSGWKEFSNHAKKQRECLRKFCFGGQHSIQLSYRRHYGFCSLQVLRHNSTPIMSSIRKKNDRHHVQVRHRGEILAIKKSRIDFRKSVLLIPTTKTDTPRTIPSFNERCNSSQSAIKGFSEPTRR